MSTETTLTGDQVMADRKRRKMGRRAYAELLGPPFTQTKVRNIELTREPRPEELEVLLRHVDVSNDAPPANGDAQANPGTSETGDAPAVYALSEEELEEQIVALGGTSVTELYDGLDQPARDPDEATVSPLPPPRSAITELDRPNPEPAPEPTPVEHPVPTQYAFQRAGYHVTNSELRTFKRCPRKWYLAYYRGLKLRDESLVGPRAIGLRVHLALAAYYSQGHDPVDTLHATVADDERRLPDDPTVAKQFQSEAELARIMIEGYLEWLRETGRDQGLKLVATEEIVEVPFPAVEGVVLVGKLDQRIEREIDGARLFNDFKTVGSLLAKTLHMDEQMLHYHLLELLDLKERGIEGQHTAGGLYTMLRKVKRTPAAKPPFYDRVEVPHNIHELRNYYIRVLGEITDIIEKRKRLDAGEDHRLVAYANPTSDCSWDCDFFAVCPLFDDGSAAEAMLETVYREAHPQEHYFPYGEREHERASVVSSTPDDNDA